MLVLVRWPTKLMEVYSAKEVIIYGKVLIKCNKSAAMRFGAT